MDTVYVFETNVTDQFKVTTDFQPAGYFTIYIICFKNDQYETKEGSIFFGDKIKKLGRNEQPVVACNCMLHVVLCAHFALAVLHVIRAHIYLVGFFLRLFTLLDFFALIYLVGFFLLIVHIFNSQGIAGRRQKCTTKMKRK
jgi:hypothetical protein